MKTGLILLVLLLLSTSCIKSDINGTRAARFAVSDAGNNRILLWNRVPNSFSEPADLVLGQPNMTIGTANNTPDAPGTISAQSLSVPMGVHLFEEKLIAADQSNHRVLIWNSWPTTNQQAADVVLGQNTMTTGGASTGTATSFSYPNLVSFDGQHLLVGDITGRRVKVWNSLPTVNNQPPNLILCQSSLTGWLLGTTSQLCMRPNSAVSNGNQVAVADWQNHRVLIWNTFPTVSGQAANVVLGQPNMTSAVINNTPGNPGVASAQSLYFWTAANQTPSKVMFVGEKLVVSDFNNNRVLVWNSIPTTNQQAADMVIGQPDMTTTTASTGAYFSSPSGMYYGGGKFMVSDLLNNRVHVWKSFPTKNGQQADFVLGQSNFINNSILPVKDFTLYSPIDVTGNFHVKGLRIPEGY